MALAIRAKLFQHTEPQGGGNASLWELVHKGLKMLMSAYLLC